MSKNIPAYLTLVLDLLNRAAALGLEIERDFSNASTMPEDAKNYIFVRVDGGSAALIIPFQSATVKWCDSHLDWQEAGRIELDRPNGAVQCRIDPSKADLDLLLTSLSGASKVARRKNGGKASQADMASFTAALQLAGKPASKQVSQPASEQVTEAPDFSDLAALAEHFES